MAASGTAIAQAPPAPATPPPQTAPPAPQRATDCTPMKPVPPQGTVAPEGTAMSHLEWFEAEGWITKDNAREFMDYTIRGIFLPARHALFFYTGRRVLL